MRQRTGDEFGENRGFEKVAPESRPRLQPVLAVDEEGIALVSDPGLLHDIIDVFEVDRHPEYPGGALFPHHDSDDEVRNLAVSHEDVADVDAVALDCIEPGLVLVVNCFEQAVIGADIGEMVALVVDDADVHVGVGLGMHDLKDLVEIGLVGQFLRRCWCWQG